MAATVEITTTQNVTIEYELTQLRERIGAFLLDIVVVGLGYLVFFMVFTAVFGVGFMDQWWGIFFMLLGVASYFGYHILCEIMLTGQTIGKKAINSRVVRLDGKEPQWSDVVLRAVLQLVDIFFSAGIIGMMLIKTTPKGQRLGDLAAHTTVIKMQGSFGRFKLNDILNIVNVNNYQPMYPQVRTLTEKDMIFIKNTLARYQKYPNPAHAEVIDQLSDRMMALLAIPQINTTRIEFLKVLLRDYIVLTR